MAKKKVEEKHLCGQCAHIELVTKFHTLSIEGKPTMGKCKYMPNRRVLLSEKSCPHYEEPKGFHRTDVP